ncbi:ATP-binding protein [Streptococcus suis]|uniref:ATP-binding protein n=1 Tax=Streptococcus suis TaxID=1307 RepID=UPI0024102D12|nr:ATP-binding protein [Streptococcus suis]MDG3136930.1 ATP-binding protein [Streptococcus suis]
MGILSWLGFGNQLRRSKIWDIQNNLVLKKDGSVFAVYEVPPKIINMVDHRAKEDLKQLEYGVLQELEKYKDHSIRTLPIYQDLLKRFSLLYQDLDRELGVFDLGEEVLEGMLNYLEDSLGEVYEYKHYLTVPLKSIHISVDLKSVLFESFRNVRNKILGLVGLEEEKPADWSKKYRSQLELLENSLSSLGVRPLQEFETLFIARYPYIRGMNIDRDVEVQLVENSLENLDDVTIELEHVTTLKVTHYDKSVYQILLPVNELPENVSHLHLQEEIQNIGFPVESDYLAQFSMPKGMFSLLSRSRRARKRLKTTENEAYEADSGQKMTVLRSLFLLDDLQTKVDEKEALLSYLQILVVTGGTMEEAVDKMRILMSSLSQIGVGLVQANADQLYLFYKTMIGEVLEAGDKNFIQPMSLEAFCENLFFTTRKVGTDVGFYIGRVDNHVSSWFGKFKEALSASSNPVYVNLLQANKLGVSGKITNNPHVGIIGETGAGKSFLTKLLFVYHSLLKGKILYIDPKAEMRKQFLEVLDRLKKAGKNKALQVYIESIDFVTLDSKKEENAGVLDPIVFLPRKEAVDLLSSMIATLLGKDNSKTIKIAYLRAINAILDRKESGQRVGSLHVFEEMQKSDQLEDVRSAGELLEFIVKDSILSLCFSDGRNSSIGLDNKITILEITGLDLPKATANVEITEMQTKSLVVMYALGYFCKRFGERNKKEETILFFDEAWFFNITSVGRSVLMELKRVGRSFNNFMVFITQSVHDLETTEDSTGFGTVFAFAGNENDDVLDYLGVPKTKETREWIGNMTMGQCIYYDTFGRKERITVDGLFEEFAELFKTVESDLKSVA